MIGSYNASAVIYAIFFMIYKMGVPFWGLMAIHGIIGIITFVETWFNVPADPIPTLEEQRLTQEYEMNQIQKKKSESPGQRQNGVSQSVTVLEDEDIPSFMAVMFSWPCLLSLLTMCITQLRIVMYIGQLAVFLQANYKRTHPQPAVTNGTIFDNNTDEEDTVHFYLTVFGWLQIFCLLVAPVIGQVLDKDLSLAIDDPQHGDKSNDDDVIYRRVQSLRNTRNAYMITQICLVVFGILLVIPVPLYVQYITFILVTVMRTFLHSTAGGLYVNVFHFAHLGKLTGLGSVCGAIFCLLNDPAFKMMNSIFNKDPFYINMGMLVLSLLGFLLPIYLHSFANGIQEKFEQINSSNREAEKLNTLIEQNANDETRAYIE